MIWPLRELEALKHTWII